MPPSGQVLRHENDRRRLHHGHPTAIICPRSAFNSFAVVGHLFRGRPSMNTPHATRSRTTTTNHASRPRSTLTHHATRTRSQPTPTIITRTRTTNHEHDLAPRTRLLSFEHDPRSPPIRLLTNNRHPFILMVFYIDGRILVSRAIKINITLPEDELSTIDRYTKEEGTTRSGLILRALRTYIRSKEEQAAERKRRLTIARASSDIRKLRAKAGKWDGVAEIRKWRDST